jgi:biopolymer transport protein ExbB
MNVLDAVRTLVDTAGVFIAPLVGLAFATFGLATWAGLRVRDVEGALADLDRVARDVTRTLRLLSAAASAAPLVGLLGTVHGLIILFAGLEQAGAFDRDTLTRGVGQALFTTEFGLAIAVPGIVLHAVIRRSLRARAGATVGPPAPRRRRRIP